MINLNKDINIYPNPMTDDLTIDWGVLNNKSIIISIYDDLGQKILDKTIAPNQAKSIKIDCSNYRQGIYLVMLNDGENSIVKKVIK